MTFSIEAFWAEDGMLEQTFYIRGLRTLPDAIIALEKANISNPRQDWKILATIESEVSESA